MYQKNPLLLEFDPGTLVTQVRSMIPHIKAGFQSAKNSAKIVSRNMKKGKKFLPSVGKQVSTTIKNDPTIFGDVIRGGELARQAAGTLALQRMAPLPTPDPQSIKQTIDAGKTFLSRGKSDSTKSVARIARNAISNPGKTGKNFVARRATLSTYAGSPINNYNGITASLLGKQFPIVDGSATMVPLTVNGISAKELGNMIRGTKDAYVGAGRELVGKTKAASKKILNKFKNLENPLRKRQLQPIYTT